MSSIIPFISMLTLLLFVCGLVVLSCLSPVHAAWQIQLPGKRSSIPENLLGGTQIVSQRVVAKNTVARFATRMQSDRSVFPGNCISDQPQQPYGWERFKYDIIKSLSISVNQGTITMTLWPRIGYSITIDETITCGPFTSAAGEDYFLGGAIADDDAYFKFSITRALRTSISLYRLVDARTPNFEVMPAADLGKVAVDAGQIRETDVRDLGLKVYIVFVNDNWNPDKVAEVGKYLKCGPVDCFAGLVWPSLFKYDTNVPCVVSLELGREHMRTFDIDQLASVTFELPDFGNGFGLKGNANVEMPSSANTFFIVTSPVIPNLAPAKPTVSLYGATFTPATIGGEATINRIIRQEAGGVFLPRLSDLLPLDNNIMRMEEACLRGRVKPLTQRCNRSLLFLLPTTPGAQLQRFGLSSVGGNTTADIYRYTLWTTTAAHPFNEMPWFTGPWDQESPPPGGWQGWEDTRSNGEGTQAMLKLAPLPEYETWLTDTIYVTLPFSAFTMLEPPAPSGGNQLRIIVTPSPGELTASLRSIVQREIWRSEVVQYLILDGESWTNESVAGLVYNAYGAIQPPREGFNTQKHLIMDPSMVSFGIVPKTGRINTTVMVIRFKMNPDYEQDVDDDYIHFRVNTSWVRSGLPLTVDPMLARFHVRKSPGELTIDPFRSSIEESEMIAGGYTMILRVAGDKFTDSRLTQCVDQLCSFWQSDVPASRDPNGWSARHRAICLSPITSPEQITWNINTIPVVPGGSVARKLNITFLPDLLYNTKRGERITIAIPPICSISTTTAPLGNYTLTILPQNGNVSFFMSYDRGVTFKNLTEISEGDLREGLVSIYLISFVDNFDEVELGVNRGPRYDVSERLYGNLSSSSLGSFGWNAKKYAFLGADPAARRKLMVVDAVKQVSNNITINVQPVPTFDLAQNETVTLQLNAEWMSSGRTPQVPSISFKIYASPGVVELVAWAGNPAPGTFVRVTEDDMRWGRVWFEFRIIGEQWRRDTAPFVRSFTSDDPSPTALKTLIGSLIPAIRFFEFRVDPVSGYEYLKLRLQSNAQYDIDRVENITMSLDAQAVVSGLQPIFDFGPDPADPTKRLRRRTMNFLIYPAPAQIILSGAVDLLNEKKMRQSNLITVYLTLIGDRWSTIPSYNDTSRVPQFGPAESRVNVWQGTVGVNGADNPDGFASYGASVLPQSSVDVLDAHTMVLRFIPDRRYKLNAAFPDPEKIGIQIRPNATVSRLVPYFKYRFEPATTTSTGILYVDKTGGELRLANESFVVTETMLATFPFKLTFAIDGDYLVYSTITGEGIAGNSGIKSAFLQAALQSSSSIIQESAGFTQHRGQLLRTRVGDPQLVPGDGATMDLLPFVLADNRTAAPAPVDNVTAPPTTTTTTLDPGSETTTTTGAAGAAPVVAVTLQPNQQLTLGVVPVRSYNIRNEEQLLLTMRNSTYFGTGIVADPSTVVVPILKVPQVIVLLLDQSVSFARTYQTDPLALKTRIAKQFGLPLTRVTTQANKPPFLANLLAMQFWFTDDANIGTAGYRDNAYLTDTFMSLTGPYLFKSLAVRLSFFQGSFDAAAFGGDNTTTALSTPIPSPSFVFGIVGAIIILLGAVAFAIGLILQKARVSVNALRPAGRAVVFKSDGKMDLGDEPDPALDERGKKISDEEQARREMIRREKEILSGVDSHMLKLSESPFFVGRNAALAQERDKLEANRAAKLRSHAEEGIKIETLPMSMREYARMHLAKREGGAAAMGLDALGLTPKDLKTGGGMTLDEELAGEKDEKALLAEAEKKRHESTQGGRYYNVDAARKRSRLDGHVHAHEHDHVTVVNLLADL